MHLHAFTVFVLLIVHSTIYVKYLIHIVCKMIDLNKLNCGLALRVISTVSGGIFAGGALYVDFVEHPARMTHDAASAITMWKPSFERAKKLQVRYFLVLI